MVAKVSLTNKSILGNSKSIRLQKEDIRFVKPDIFSSPAAFKTIRNHSPTNFFENWGITTYLSLSYLRLRNLS